LWIGGLQISFDSFWLTRIFKVVDYLKKKKKKVKLDLGFSAQKLQRKLILDGLNDYLIWVLFFHCHSFGF